MSKLDNKIKLLLVILVTGAFLAVLNETILNVALHSISTELEVNYSIVQWLVTGYMLVIGTIIPISAFFMRRYTTRQLFITAMSLFVAGSIISAFSPSFLFLLIGRLVQAFGTALIIPLLTNIILMVVPKERRGVVMGSIMSLVFMFAPAIGPTISGLLVENLSWRWAFYIIIPIALFTLVIGIKIVQNVTETSKPRLDIISYILSILGFGGIVYGFSAAGEGGSGFTESTVIISLSVGILALILFGWRQLKMDEPVLDIRVFKNPMFSLSLILVMTVMMIMFSLTLMLPTYMQSALLFPAMTAGLVMLPGGLVNAIFAPVTGKIFDKYGPRPLLIPGSIILVGVTFSLRYTTPGIPIWVVIAQHMILMLSVAMMLMPSQTNALNQLTRDMYPHGSATATTLMQVSGAIGAALFIAISENTQTKLLSNIQEPTQEQLINAVSTGTNHSFTVGFYFAIISLILSLFIKKAHK